MQHSIPHDLDQATARLATHKALDSYRARFAEYKPEGSWRNDDEASIRFTIAGKTLDGRVFVRPSVIDLELDVPLLFRPFRSIAIRVIEEEIQGWIAKARSGELA